MEISTQFPRVQHSYVAEKAQAWKRDLEAIARQIDRYVGLGTDTSAIDLEAMLDLGALRREFAYIEQHRLSAPVPIVLVDTYTYEPIPE